MAAMVTLRSGTLSERRTVLVHEFEKLNLKVRRVVYDGGGPTALVGLSSELRDLTDAAVELTREIDKNNTVRMNEGWGPDPVYPSLKADQAPDSYGPPYRSFARLRETVERKRLRGLFGMVFALGVAPAFGAGVCGLKFLPIFLVMQALALAPLMVHAKFLQRESSRWRQRALTAERLQDPQ